MAFYETEIVENAIVAELQRAFTVFPTTEVTGATLVAHPETVSGAYDLVFIHADKTLAFGGGQAIYLDSAADGRYVLTASDGCKVNVDIAVANLPGSDKTDAIAIPDPIRPTLARQVSSYAGEFEDAVKNILAVCPAALAVYGGGEYEEVARKVFRRTLEFQILLGSRNLRGDAAQRKGDPLQLGCYDLLEIVRRALAGNTLNLQIERLKPIEDGRIAVTRQLAVYGVTFRTAFTFKEEESSEGLLKGLDAKYYLQPEVGSIPVVVDAEDKTDF